MIEQVLLIDTLTMNPFIGIQIAAIMQTIYMVFLAYSHFIGTNQLNLKRERENPIIILIKFVYLMLNIIFRALFGLLSVLLVDFSAGWLLGAWDYTDWKYQLPSAILSLIIGIQYIYKVYIKPYEFKSGILMEKNYKNENSDSQSDKNNAKRSQSLLNIKSEGLCLTLKVKDSIIRIDLQGNPIDENNDFSPSSEIKMHIEAYKCRPDIRVVLHAHPIYATTFASIGKDLNDNILPEATLQLGSIPVAKYGTPSTNDLSKSIIKPLQTSDAVLLENHGVIVVAENLKMAQFKIEILEHYCHVLYNLNNLNQSKRLTDSQVLQLIELRKSNKLPGRALIKYSNEEVQFK